MTAHASEAAVETGIAGVLDRHRPIRVRHGSSCLCGWRGANAAHAAHVAAALLASPEFAGMVAAAKAEALREADAAVAEADGYLNECRRWNDMPADSPWFIRDTVIAKAEAGLMAVRRVLRAASHGEGK